MKKAILSLSASIFLYLFCLPARAATIYVDINATGANNGSNWTDSYTDLQGALDVAFSGDEIWVAAGTYYPSVENGGAGDRYRSFQMQNGVSIYGGFDGNETSRDQRDWKSNKTILSGDIDGNGSLDDGNCYHVFYHPDSLALDNTAMLDGFTITGGNADGSAPHYYGGGMFNDASSPTVTNCIFSESKATFSAGGMFNGNDSSPMVTNCLFSGNEAYYGGGMFNSDSSPTVLNCRFSENLAGSGGGMCNDAASPAVINCTFRRNDAFFGGGMCNDAASPTIGNCILWEDTAASDGNEVYNLNGGMPGISHCSIEGSGGSGDSWDAGFGTDNGGNIDSDPEFAGTDDLHLTADSPCIDTGSNEAATDMDMDMDGDARFFDGDSDGDVVVDMGADEVVDSDGDRILDYLDPDDDNDGLTDAAEKDFGTDPLNSDTDGDGLLDYLEIYVHDTDPLESDTDGDGLSDGEEVQTYGTDPLEEDTDGDGLSDGEEVHTYGTDPQNDDTDNDGLSDGEEVLTYGTDPLDNDADDDGQADGYEVATGSNPLVADNEVDPEEEEEETQSECFIGVLNKEKWASGEYAIGLLFLVAGFAAIVLEARGDKKIS